MATFTRTTAASTATTTHDTAWDDVFVNPHQASLAEGRQQGQSDGARAGQIEGVRLGSITAVNYGMELGFIQGVVHAIVSMHDASRPLWSADTHKIDKSLAILQQCLDDFPPPDVIFHESRDRIHHVDSISNSFETTEVIHDSPYSAADAVTDRVATRDDTPHTLDVTARMQRIRARFKLLMVQLSLPHFSLAYVMDVARPTSATSTTERGTRDTDATATPETAPKSSEW